MIHDAICRLAAKRGMSINQLAKKAGIHPAVISRWKRAGSKDGKYFPSYKNQVKIADALGITINTLKREAEKDPEGGEEDGLSTR